MDILILLYLLHHEHYIDEACYGLYYL